MLDPLINPKINFLRNLHFSQSVAQLRNNIKKVALPIIFITALSNFPLVNGGPISWAGCIVACETVAASATVVTAGAAAGSLIACVNACAPLLMLPFIP